MSVTDGKASNLPVELIRYIFDFLSPCDIVRLRQVSKQFHDISLDPLLWREAYARARLPRPSGPYPWQSTHYLEDMLVQSDLLSKSWTSRPAEIVSRKASLWKLMHANMWALILGRWCIWMVDNTIYCRDINTHSFQLLYDGSGDVYFLFEAYPRTSRDGQRIYLLLTDYGSPDQFLRLLEFNVKDSGLSEPKILDLLHLDPQQGELAIQEHQHKVYDPSPFLIIQAVHNPPRFVVFDIRTQRLYRLPQFSRSGPYQLPSFSDHELRFRTTTLLVPTRTHIIAFRVVDTADAVTVVIQAFSVPESSSDPITSTLHLTHQAVFYDEERMEDGTVAKSVFPFSNTSLLRNSVVDPATNSINIKILYASNTLPPINTRVSFLDLTLLGSPATSSEVLPIHVRREHLFESVWVSRRFTASEDGHARGILVSVLADPHRMAIRKFTIDASGDMCTAEFGEPSSVTVPRHIDWNDVVFDGVTGKIHYFDTQPGVHLLTMDIV